MNYQDIKTFLTIVSSSSLSKAAEVLFVSQPALSHRLSALEEELGTELIIRKKGSRTLELTDAGQRFVPLARKWEQLWLETSKIQYEKPQDILFISCRRSSAVSWGNTRDAVFILIPCGQMCPTRRSKTKKSTWD